jgi:hypothetical protein
MLKMMHLVACSRFPSLPSQFVYLGHKRELPDRMSWVHVQLCRTGSFRQVKKDAE